MLWVFSTILGLNEKKSIHAGIPSLSAMCPIQGPSSVLYGYPKSAIKEEWLASTVEALNEVDRKEQPNPLHHRSHPGDKCVHSLPPGTEFPVSVIPGSLSNDEAPKCWHDLKYYGIISVRTQVEERLARSAFS